ncbi:hypothetical protein AAHE18_19G135100 [Arachis hypogaea]
MKCGGASVAMEVPRQQGVTSLLRDAPPDSPSLRHDSSSPNDAMAVTAPSPAARWRRGETRAAGSRPAVAAREDDDNEAAMASGAGATFLFSSSPSVLSFSPLSLFPLFLLLLLCLRLN